MGVNDHARPGDFGVVHSGNTPLYWENPEATGHYLNSRYDDPRYVVTRLAAGTQVLILGMIPAGSAKKGHVFVVVAGGKVGWLWNYDLMVWDR